MNISVELHGQLSPSSPRRQVLVLEEHATAGNAAAALGLDPEEIGLITINNTQSELQDPLPPGCRLCFFPYVTGG
jgi:molybdopterin converting factor small subunit